MAVLPAEIPTGLVTGQFYFVNEDNVDADTDPELVVVQGKVTFTCSAKVLRMPSKLATVVPLVFDAEFDSQGRLVSSGDTSKVGLELPATDSPLFNPTAFTWRVEFSLVKVDNRYTVQIDPFDIQVPAGGTIDLTTAMPVSTSPGVLTVQGPKGDTGPTGPKGDTGPVADISGKVDKNTLAIVAAAPGGVDDTSVLAAAITAASTSSFTKTVTGTTGTYVVTGLTVPAGVVLRGIVVKHKAGSATGSAAITLSGVGSRAESVEVDGNAANQTNTGLLGIFVRADRAVVADCYVHDTQWDGIVVGSNPLGVSVRNSRVIVTGRYGITVNGVVGSCPRSTIFHGNYVERSTDGGLGIVGVGEDTIFSSNTTRDTGGDGIAAYSGSNTGTVCVGNTFYNPANNGIHLGGTDLVMTGNKAYNVGQTAWFLSNANGQGSAVTGIIANNLADTVGKHGVWVQSTTDVTVTGNVLKNVTREHGVLLDECIGYVVSNNIISGVVAGRGVFLTRSGKGTVSGNNIHDIFGEAILGRDYATGTLRAQYVTVVGNHIRNAAAGIVSSESSDYWTVGMNTFAGGITGAETSLVGSNNKVYAPAPAVDPSLRYVPTGALATTIDRRTVDGTSIPAIASGTMRLTAVWLTKGTVVSSITYVSGSTAAGLTDRWYALFDYSRNLLGTTADNTTAWTAGTPLTIPLTASYTVPADGLYYVGFCEVATTTTALRGRNTSSNALSISPVLNGDSGTGLTNAASTPATSPGGWAVQGGMPFAYVS